MLFALPARWDSPQPKVADARWMFRCFSLFLRFLDESITLGSRSRTGHKICKKKLAFFFLFNLKKNSCCIKIINHCFFAAEMSKNETQDMIEFFLHYILIAKKMAGIWDWKFNGIFLHTYLLSRVLGISALPRLPSCNTLNSKRDEKMKCDKR